MSVEEVARELRDIIFESKNIFVLTGAGVSTPSGIPDFRGKGGIYEKISPEVFDITLFYRNPEIFYTQIGPIVRKLLKAKPNPSHFLVTELEKLGKLSLVATQNIDGLHKKAGTSKVAELHGTLEKAHCTKCGRKYSKEDILKDVLAGKVPYCECGGVIKPDVVFFGETLPQKEFSKAIEAAGASDLCIVMGSSLVVQPAASLPLYTLDRRGKLVIINIGETPLDRLAFRKFELPVEKLSAAVISLLNRSKD